MKKVLLVMATVPLLAFGGGNLVSVGYERVDFDHSVKKDRGWRASVFGRVGLKKDRFEALLEKSRIDTFQPPAPKDLQVAKIGLKYLHTFEKAEMAVSFATIDDNLMKQTDGGKIYGVALRRGGLRIAQYLSDYKHFDVWQTEAGYSVKREWNDLKVGASAIVKYIRLSDRKSNAFSKNAKADYVTPGLFLSLHTSGWHFRTGALFGRRIFAVMQEGMKVQHHAMEFYQTWMAAVAKDLGSHRLSFRYVYQKADEIPIHNDGVRVQSVALVWGYRF